MRPFHESLADSHNFKIYGFKTYRNDLLAFKKMKNSFTAYLRGSLEAYSGKTLEGFSLETYHEHVERNSIDHHGFIKSCGRVVSENSVDLSYLDKLVNIANDDLSGSFKIYRSRIEFRVVRPSFSDNNESHRDHWFPYFTPLVNTYVPLAGSNYDSAMRIVPFSHDWSDDDVVPTFTYEESAAGKKFIKNGIEYSVPAVASCSKPINLHAVDMTEGDFMLFSPKLVHGGGGNTSNKTRFSFEIRLENIVE